MIVVYAQMRVSLGDVITQYTVLDKELLNLYDADKSRHDLELKSVKYRHHRFDDMLHSYVRSTPMYKFHTLWKHTKNAIMPRCRKWG
jgi:hypothetical protein